MGDVGLVKVDAAADNGLVGAVQVKEVQGVAVAVVARHQHVVLVGAEGAEAEGHVEVDARVGDPALGGDPGVGLLLLLEIHKPLAEEAVAVAEPRAVAGEIQRCDGIEEARRQTPQAAVSKGRLGLLFLDLLQGKAVGLEHGLGLVKEPQVDEIVG